MGHSVALNFADGKTFFIGVNDKELLLDAAVRQGITLPLDCREGVCGTCQGQCDTGEYDQDYVDEEALSENDLAARKILACQTRVQSDASFYFEHDSSFCQAGDPLKLEGTVKSLEFVSENTAILEIDASEHTQLLAFLPGQYARLHIPNTGQYRAYSFANSPQSDNHFRFLIRLVEHGLMGSFLKKECQIGQSIKFELPFGSFYLREIDSKRPLYFIAGGTGLSAFLAMLDQCQNKSNLPPIYLYYGVRDQDDLAEQARILQYQQHFKQLHYIPVLSRADDAWTGLSGYIQHHLDAQVLQNQAFDMYICGSPALIDGVKDWLKQHDISHANVYSEKFLSTHARVA